MIVRSEKPDQSSLILFLSGRLDTVTSSTLEQKFNELIDGTLGIIFDLKELSYISSSGLHLFLQVQRTMSANNRRLVVRNATGSVKDVFFMTGFNRIITLEE